METGTEVVVYDLSLLSLTKSPGRQLLACTGQGTYVRTLLRDWAKSRGAGAYAAGAATGADRTVLDRRSLDAR